MQIADPHVRKLIYGSTGFVLGAKKQPVFIVVDVPDPARWAMTCSCEDFARHAEKKMEQDELDKRIQGARGVNVVRQWEQYGARFFRTETVGKKSRFHDVTLVRGGDSPWLCKHMIAVLMTGCIVDMRKTEIVLEADGVAVNGCKLVESAAVQGGLFNGEGGQK